MASAAELLRDSAGPVLFRGAGSAIKWGGRPAPPDLVVETAGMDRLIEHNAGDMTAAVGAGMPLRRLQETLAAAGQWLAIDPPS
ncbi:MAG: FAD-dependent oxidoreductase, partial [Actinomycetota bacterium]|nr:FAD-dependent oxidoreductase [Actinomycetota bacterium]